MEKSEISLLPFKKALASLHYAAVQPKNEFTRDATIQRFEYTFELAWKIMKRYLSVVTGHEEFQIKDIFREAGRQQLISNVENWFDYLKVRNLTSHTYNELTAEETYEVAQKFVNAAEELLRNLELKLQHAT